MMTVDRIEGNIAVICDGEKHFDADISLFDGKVCEGDVVRRAQDGRFRTDIPATKKRRREMLDMQNSLWKE